MNVNTIPFYQHGIKGLREAVNQCTREKNVICHRCNSTKTTFSCNGGNHLLIDIECLDNEQLATRLGYPGSSRHPNQTAELCNDIYFCDKQYKLVAAVIYISGTIGHYITYIRKTNWPMAEVRWTRFRQKAKSNKKSRTIRQKNNTFIILCKELNIFFHKNIFLKLLYKKNYKIYNKKL